VPRAITTTEIEPVQTNSEAIHDIVKKYFKTNGTCKYIVKLLESISDDDNMSFSQIFSNISSSYRPDLEIRFKIINDLQRKNLFNFSSHGRSIIITRGKRFETEFLSYKNITSSNTLSISEIEPKRYNYSAVFNVIKKYFKTIKQCRFFVDYLESISVNETVPLSRYVFASTVSRVQPPKLNHETQINMMKALMKENLFIFHTDKRTIYIKKGNRYLSQNF
jgi:hypothetical protein